MSKMLVLSSKLLLLVHSLLGSSIYWSKQPSYFCLFSVYKDRKVCLVPVFFKNQREEIKLVSVPFIWFLQTIFVVSNHWLLVSPTMLVLSKYSDKVSCYPVAPNGCSFLFEQLVYVWQDSSWISDRSRNSLPEEKWWKSSISAFHQHILMH